MGISKAMMEKVAIAESRNLKNTTVCLTRYGNVMASRGSVIPLFINQIKKGDPITITDPNMTRFLMSLDESVELVLTAFEEGENGDIFVKKSPSSTIHNLALALIEIFNKKVKVNTIGTRHGEKMHEVLISREEMLRTSDLGDFYKIKADNRDLNYEKYFTTGNINARELKDYSSNNSNCLKVNDIKNMLLNDRFIKEIVCA